MTLLARLAALAPHLHPNVAKSAEWEKLKADLAAHGAKK